MEETNSSTPAEQAVQQPIPQAINNPPIKPKKPIWKRWWFWVLAIFVLAVIGSSNEKSNTQTVSNNPTSTPTSNQSNTDTSAQNVTTAATSSATVPSEKITIKNSTAKDTGYGSTDVTGEATNNDSTQHNLTLKATFYDAKGAILGTAVGVLSQLDPGVTKTFTLMSTDKIGKYANMKVQVDSLF